MASRGCSFCGKDRESVRHLVSGPRRVGICDECIEVAAEVAAEALRPHGSDRLLTGASMAITNDSRRGGRLGIVEDPTVAIQAGKVTWVGPRAETPPMYGRLPELDCEGGMVIPAFADARTLPIAAPPGDVDAEEMAESAVRLVDRMVQAGTAVLQASPRPSTDPVAVTAQLAILRALPGRLPLHVHPGLRIEGDPVPSLLEVAARTATHVTIPVGAGGPPVDRVPALAERCRRMGLAVRLVDTGALTADLLVAVEPLAVESPGAGGDLVPALVRVGSAVVVDGAYPAPDGRPVADLLAAGVPVAIATGCDADHLAVTSCAFAAWLAWSAGAVEMDDALWCVTRGGALALGDDRRGRIAPGAPGDLLVLDAAEPLGLAAHPDRSPVRVVVRDGDVLVA